MDYFWVFIVSAFSIVPPAIAAAIRLRSLSGRYFPLLVLLWIGLINEIISYALIINHSSNLANSNIYTLIEFGLLLWLFYRLTNRKNNRFFIAGIVGFIVWIADNFFMHPISQDNMLFRMSSSFFIVFVSMDKICYALFSGRKEVYKKPDLLLCFSFFVYYTYKTFIAIFIVFPMGLPDEYYQNFWLILSLINIATNITYLIAIVWIHKRQEYILR